MCRLNNWVSSSKSDNHRTPSEDRRVPQLPPDVEECVRSWIVLEASGFEHRLFDESAAGTFISRSLSARHKRAFERCYHPAMQAHCYSSFSPVMINRLLKCLNYICFIFGRKT
jgi:hypothetical protein